MKLLPKYDLIIVGSGFASIFFLLRYLEISKRDVSVLILERGYNHDLNWRLQNRRSIQPYGIVSDINYQDTFINKNSAKDWVYNPSFGGGSNCWWGCTPRFLPNDFKMNSTYGVGRDWPITYDELEPYYQRAEEVMNISGPDDHICKRSKAYPQPPHNLNDVDKILKKSYPDHYFAQPTARARVATSTRTKCCASGVCYLCPVNSKFTIGGDLADPLFKSDRINVQFDAEVKGVTKEGDIITSVLWQSGEKEYETKGEVVALGANAIFNAAILQNSGFQHQALGSYLSEQVSQNVRVYLDGVKNFSGSTSITANGYMLYDTPLRRTQGACLIESINIPTFRPEKNRHTEVAVFKFIVEDLPNKENKVLMNKDAGKPEVIFNGYSEYATKTLGSLPSEVEKILSPLPVEKIEFAPSTGRSEAHILGTTVMGDSREDSIIDKNLVHHDYRNLLVLGGGAFPTITPSNPTLTICALSLRAADQYFGKGGV